MKDIIRARRQAEHEQNVEAPESKEESQPPPEALVVEDKKVEVFSLNNLSTLMQTKQAARLFMKKLSNKAQAKVEADLPNSSLPLHQAAETGDLETLKDLLAKVMGRENIDQHDGDCFDMTALMLAADKEQTPIIAELLHQRADINAVQHPAHYEKQSVDVAAEQGRVFKMDAGRTALMIAATAGSVKVVTQLLEMKADANKVSAGKTALDWARLCERAAVVDLLQEAGGITREDLNLRTFCMAAGVDFETSEVSDATVNCSRKFEEWDGDDSGFIDSTELEGIMLELKVQFTRKDIHNLMREMGATRNNQLSRDKFLKFCAKTAETRAPT